MQFETQKLIIELLNQELKKANRIPTLAYHKEIQDAKKDFITYMIKKCPKRQIVANRKKYFGMSGMVYTIVYHQYNGDTAASVVYGPPDHKKMISLVKKDYKRFICLMKGNHKVYFSK